jgi:DNA polymerase III sliding clamp (beta) subunit (PCNA family)
MEFEAIIRQSTLDRFLDTFESIVQEATLFARDGELYGQPVDPANVAMVNQWLDAEAFEHYHVGDAPIRLGLNLEQLHDFIDKADSDTLVQLEYNAENRRLNVDIGSADYNMALIDPDAIRDGTSVDDSDTSDGMTTDVEVYGAAVKHAIDVVGMVSDHVEIDSDPDRENPVHFIGEGDTDDTRVRFGESLQDGSSVDADAESLFSHEYWEDLVSALPKQAAVRIRAGDEWPCRLDYEHSDGAVDVTMMCAPRIKSQ